MQALAPLSQMTLNVSSFGRAALNALGCCRAIRRTAGEATAGEAGWVVNFAMWQ
jgi:hypothetical protein